jgi:hypothetical protein
MVDLMEALGGGYHNPDLPQTLKKSEPQSTMISTVKEESTR